MRKFFLEGKRDNLAHGRMIEEKEKYLTPEQQIAALELRRRHGVEFKMPESSE